MFIFDSLLHQVFSFSVTYMAKLVTNISYFRPHRTKCDMYTDRAPSFLAPEKSSTCNMKAKYSSALLSMQALKALNGFKNFILCSSEYFLSPSSNQTPSMYSKVSNTRLKLTVSNVRKHTAPEQFDVQRVHLGKVILAQQDREMLEVKDFILIECVIIMAICAYIYHLNSTSLTELIQET